MRKQRKKIFRDIYLFRYYDDRFFGCSTFVFSTFFRLGVLTTKKLFAIFNFRNITFLHYSILCFPTDISFTRRSRGLTAVGTLMFDKMISGRQLVFMEINKPISQLISNTETITRGFGWKTQGEQSCRIGMKSMFSTYIFCRCHS